MLSERNWQPEGVLRMLGGLFITIFVVSIAASGIQQLIGDFSIEKPSLVKNLVKVLFSQAIVLIWVLYFLRNQKLHFPTAFGLRQKIPRTLFLGVIAGVSVVPVAWMLQMISVQLLNLLQLNPESQELVQMFQESTKADPETNQIYQQFLFGFSVILLAPVVEEILFRGILYPTIKNLGLPRIALWVTAIVFSLLHANMAGFLPLCFLGIVLVLVYEETDNLLAPILVHSIFNTANFLFMLYENPISRFLFRS